MEKLINYIKNGKGLGLLFLLASAVLMTIIYMFATKEIIKNFEPKIMLIANDVLPISIKEQKIVSPLDTYKRIDVNLSDTTEIKESFPVVLDTKNETLDLKNEKLGLFITRDFILLKTPKETQKVEYKDGDYDINTFKQLYANIFGKLSLIASVIFIALFFLNLLIKTITCALLGLLGCKLFKFEAKVSLDYTMRLSAIIIAILEVINLILVNLLSINITALHVVILSVILELIFLSKQKENNQDTSL